MMLRGNRPARVLILIMITIVVTGIAIATVYYRSVNGSVDPRVVPARLLYSQYDSYAQAGDYTRLLILLDSIEDIYKLYPHYAKSYEVGVICNNRAAALLTISLYGDSIRADYNPFYGIDPDSVSGMAEENALQAINTYNGWLDRYRGKSEEQVAEEIREQFFDGLTPAEGRDKSVYLKARAREICRAVPEADRRLSVCYTNLGVIYRQREEYDKAIEQYVKALELWDRNLSAENNLNILLGRPVKKRTFIQNMFPPEK
ncbi:MAG: tetratricopeptide repeat protein [Bacteroidales bacterium]